MLYKTILLSLNDVARAGAMIDAAIAVADSQDAHVIGCYIIPAVVIYPEIGFSGVGGVYDGNQIYFKQHLDEVKRLFESKTAAAGIKAEWCAVESAYSEIASSLLEHAYSSDLIISSQTAEVNNGGIESDLVERLLMESGRPVLMLPQGATFAAPDIAIIGYNASREAARALFDALPLLRQAKDVRVVWVDPQTERSIAGEVPCAEAAAALARHGIKATAEGLPSGINAGEALLQRANDLGAGLVVMGAYAHSRLREYIFGGATQHVLGKAVIPVLMSH
jgi:nucleotide-binding universal stress UspA family protein